MAVADFAADRSLLNVNYRKHCPICKKHMREHNKEAYENCMKELVDTIKGLKK